jgi:hypothetical protein
VDEKVEKVVTKDIEFPKIVIEGKGEIGKDPNGHGIGISDQLFQSVKGKNFDLNIWVIKDVGFIIEL